MPQKRSSFSLSLAVTSLPSAVTTSTEVRLSHVNPYLGESQPYPPPSVKPPTPVVVTRPPGVASAKSWVSRSNSPHSAPALARALRDVGSTRTPLRLERSISTPSSTTHCRQRCGHRSGQLVARHSRARGLRHRSRRLRQWG